MTSREVRSGRVRGVRGIPDATVARLPVYHRALTGLADRVAVFSARPGSIKQLIAVDEPHPRKPEFVTSAKFATIRNALYGLLHDEIRKTMAEAGIAVGQPR